MSSGIIWLAIAIGVLVVFLIAQLVYLAVVLSWEDTKTLGLGYYGLSVEGRDRFKRTLRIHARLLYPILRLLGRFSKFRFENASIRHDGVAGPKGMCSEESFAEGAKYEPRAEDVFVVTQMKCGTTWMQHVLYEALNRGGGDLVAQGKTIYSVSPWLESRKGVPIDEAPLVGEERPSRIIKTHLPVPLCPYDPAARYVYVARHPVSCFASCADFIATNVGAIAPELDQVEEWYRSEELMWWGTWPTHVRGWWDRANQSDNVLFVHFEEMKEDLAAVVGRVVEFLGMRALSPEETEQVVHKCGFGYMQEHKHAFEMHPPHVLQTDADLFVRGSTDRHRDVPAAVRERVMAWCSEELADSDFPMDRVYPAVTGR